MKKCNCLNCTHNRIHDLDRPCLSVPFELIETPPVSKTVRTLDSISTWLIIIILAMLISAAICPWWI